MNNTVAIVGLGYVGLPLAVAFGRRGRTIGFDLNEEKLASYRQGCDALISHDNGKTWNTDRMYTLDSWPYYNPERWFESVCGHLFSVSLGDGSVLTCYGHYPGGGVAIKWRP